MSAELSRLTARDLWLIDLLDEHQVLATEHIASLGFTSLHTARNRLALLHQRGVLARFRIHVPAGTQPYRWCLGYLAACYLAERDGRPVPRQATVQARVDRLSARSDLQHLLGANGFFVDLAYHARHNTGTALNAWWSETGIRRRNATGDGLRPDGYGHWQHDGRHRQFWLEYDRGTETTKRVIAKLDGYARLHRVLQYDHAICIRMQTLRQENELHTRLTTHPAVTGGLLTVASMSGHGHPAGTVWRIAGSDPSRRWRLAELPSPGASP